MYIKATTINLLILNQVKMNAYKEKTNSSCPLNLIIGNLSRHHQSKKMNVLSILNNKNKNVKIQVNNFAKDKKINGILHN